MAARRGSRSKDTTDVDPATGPDSGPAEIGAGRGPYDIEDLASEIDLGNSHLDLGSVLVPVVEGGQVTVEMTADHQPQAVYLVTPHGRISVAAFAAPRSPGMWREVVGELVESLQTEGAQTAIEDGHWGREVVAAVPGAVHRFIGVDGPRWMVRCVCSGPPELADDLAPVARAVLSESVVRRGSDPHPPRDALPVILPPVLAEQVAAAQEHMATEGAEPGAATVDAVEESTPADELVIDSLTEGEGAREQIARAQVIAEPDPDADPVAEVEPEPEPEPEPARRSSGSALQRLRRRQGR
ncbi:DUF3710 domain-containing protein [Williamsia sp.]|uniref:DUF3710 domain-containing protein n=1 Tax=Williamsia sp. TaxID=1872085 RepID=UPI001A22579C|nr:DUF3710 domain-containing protein [Williamsia sp.]MBJ7288381.1 DUF3710 domain-containing protein [Williamsia sp.]